MKPGTVQHSIRLPRRLHEDSVDVAAVFGINLNRFILGAIERCVESQLRRDVVRNAVDRVREARRTGIARKADSGNGAAS